MKTTNFKGAIAALLASVMLTSSFTGCAEDNVNDEAARALFFGNEEVTETVDDTTNDVTTPAAPAAEGDNNEADACSEELEKANQIIADLTAAYDALVAEFAVMQAQLDAVNALASENQLKAEDAEAKRVNATNQLKAKAAELADTKNQLVEAEKAREKAEQAVAEANNPFTFNEEGFPIEIDFEDALEILKVEMANNTYGYLVGEGYDINVTDTSVLKANKPYWEQTFQFAHSEGSPYVFYGVDKSGTGRTYCIAEVDKPMYACNDVWAQPAKKGEGFKMLETNKMHGASDIALAFGSAIDVFEDPSSEYGWSLCLNVTGAEYVKPQKPAPKPQEPEVIVQFVEKEVIKEIEVPVIQEVEVPVIQEVEVPVIQKVEVPVIQKVEVPVFVPVIVPGEEDDDDDNDNNPENNPSRPDEDEFAPDGPADMPPEDDENDNAPENNPSRPDEDEFAPDGPADMPTDDNTGDNAGNDDTQDNGPADMPTDNNTGDNAGNDDTQDNGPADMPTDNNTGDNAGNDDTQDNGPVDMPDPENNNSRDDESEFASENEDESNFADSDVEDEIVDEGPQDMAYEPENSDATDFESEFAD